MEWIILLVIIFQSMPILKATQNKGHKKYWNKCPFNVDGGSFKIEKMWQYYIDNELTATNFDELIETGKRAST